GGACVGLAAAVEVAHRHEDGVSGDGVGFSSGGDVRLDGEGAVAVPVADAHVKADHIGDGEVLSAVAVEVPHRHARGAADGGDVRRGGEAAGGAAGPQEDADDLVVARNGDGEVGLV